MHVDYGSVRNLIRVSKKDRHLEVDQEKYSTRARPTSASSEGFIFDSAKVNLPSPF